MHRAGRCANAAEEVVLLRSKVGRVSESMSVAPFEAEAECVRHVSQRIYRNEVGIWKMFTDRENPAGLENPLNAFQTRGPITHFTKDGHHANEVELRIEER